MSLPNSEPTIHVYKPLTEGRPFYAYIEDQSFRFSAPTAMGAMKKARAWANKERGVESGKLVSGAG